MSLSEDIEDGIICRSCYVYLESDEGYQCDLMCPIYCQDCWKELPENEKCKFGYFNKKNGEIKYEI